MVVRRVQHLPFRSRTWPLPRATAVSKVNQASATSPDAFASPSIFQLLGLAWSRVAASMSLTASLPSAVLMFQVKDTRSRQ